jgi:hypothetical protein
MRPCLLLLILLLPPTLRGEQPSVPLPDVPTLLHQAQAHQAALEKTRENYTYVERTVITELNKDGSTKKTETEENEVFFVNSHEVERKVSKNGKELSPSEQDKETEHVKKEVEKAQKTPPGEAENGDQISVGRLLAIMKYSPAHRETIDGRSTIVFDYTGDPHADTHGRAENAAKKLSGTVWIDERDLQVRRISAHLDGDFHVGFGLFTLVKGSSFAFEQKLVNGELWLPVSAHVHIVGKAMGLFGYRGEVQVEDGNYQRFHVEAEPQKAAAAVNHPVC